MRPTRRQLVRGLPIAIILVAALLPCRMMAMADDQKRVLVVYSTRRETQFATVGDGALPGRLERGLGEKIDYYAEYLDAARFPEAQQNEALRDYVRGKYAGTRFDLVIAVNDLALDFVAAHRDELFPGTSVVFLSENRGARRIADSTGVVAPRDFRSTLEIALALQPETDEVVVVVGSSSRDRVAEAAARAQFESFAPSLRFTYLSNLTTEEVERRMAALPPRAIGYYLLFYQDSAGLNVNPTEYFRRIAAVANRPLYSWVDSTVDYGVVGGGLSSIGLRIQAVADLAVRVLRGERADGIPVHTLNHVVNQVDWRQLQRWGISEARVPPGTQILHRPLSAWTRYKGYIVAAAALLIGQMALIAVLLIQRRKLGRAEDRIRHDQQDLRESYERIRDLGARLLTAQDVERSRIAFELHDDISQQMAVLSMKLQVLSGFGPVRDDDAEALAREALDQAEGVALSLRELSHRLYPAKLRLMGLVSAIAGLQRDFSRDDLTVVFSHDKVPTDIPHDLTLALFRVVQEALRNAAEHSGARKVFVRLEGRKGSLALIIVDEGVGFDVEAAWGKGLGLVSMQERLEPIGGALTIHSTPGAGTRLEIVVPLMMAGSKRSLAV